VMYMQINEPPPAIPGTSEKVQAVLDKALRKNPDDRYQSSQQMAVDYFLAIGMNAEAETILDRPPSKPEIQAPSEAATISSESQPVQPSTSAVSPNRKWLFAGIGLVLFLAVVVGAWVFSFITSSGSSVSTQSPTITKTISSTSTNTEPPTDVVPSAENMVEIPAGSYVIGRPETDDFHSAIQTIDSPGFWIDIYQVTNAQYQQFMEATGTHEPLIYPAPDKSPVRGVTWDEANAYCEWIGKRLPNEAEWEVAGRGPGNDPQLYPWGNDPSDGLKLPEVRTYEVGSIAFNVSPFGVYDLVGNVWEWTGEPYAAVQNGFRVLHGGRFGLPQDLAYRLPVSVDDDAYTKYTGFRCAADQVK